MADAAYDTSAEIQRLQDAGIPQDHAEAIARSIRSGTGGGAVTKDALERVEERLGGEIKLVHKDIDLVRKDVEALDTKIDLVKDTLEAKIDASVRVLDGRIDKQGVALGMQIANLQTEFANGVAEIARGQVVAMRWVIGLMITFFLGIGGLILAALRVLLQSG